VHLLQHFEDCSAELKAPDIDLLKEHLARHKAQLEAMPMPPRPPEAEAHSGLDRHAVETPRKAAPLARPRRRTAGSPRRLGATRPLYHVCHVQQVARSLRVHLNRPRQTTT
jgi:hypothetical protein